MANHAGIYIVLGACLLIVLVVGPLRTGAAYLLKTFIPMLFTTAKVVFHQVVAAHVNVAQNLQPRQRVLYELDRHRTSHTDEK